MRRRLRKQGHITTGRRGVIGAWLCLCAALYALLILPGLHSAVHALEAGQGHHRPTVDTAPESRATLGLPRHHHHHHHHGQGGSSPLEHGRGAAEHFGVALLTAPPILLPPPPEAVEFVSTTAVLDSIFLAQRPEPRTSRGPPSRVV